MTGAMYAAISGLKSHMTKLNVIGNNVANVNTVGYKSQRALFSDSMYTMYSSGSNGTDVKGGKNPSQIGYGSQLSSIDLNMTGGTFTPGAPMDCMLEGEGFFLVGDKNVANIIDPHDPESLKSLKLTRVGDFRIGPDGYLTDGGGNTVYGFMTVGVDAEGKPIVSDQLVPLRLPRMEKVWHNKDGQPISQTEYEGLDPDKQKECKQLEVPRYAVAATKDDKPVTPGNINDADIKHVPVEDYWPLDGQGQPVKADENPLPFAQVASISFDRASGKISGTMKDTGEPVTIGYLAIGNVTNVNGVSHDSGYYYKCGDGAGDMQVSLLGGAGEKLKTPGGHSFSHVNGSLAGQPGVYPTPAELAALSDKCMIGSAGDTKLRSGGLEGSNADLATEISELITTQRGYQANTRIITVTDTMLEELVNMKR